MTLKELQPCTHVERVDRIIEFEKHAERYHALCPVCGEPMVWENWTKLCEPLRAACNNCGRTIPSTEINLEIRARKEISHGAFIRHPADSR